MFWKILVDLKWAIDELWFISDNAVGKDMEKYPVNSELTLEYFGDDKVIFTLSL